MKTIGLIGGMSWESTIPYYSIINEEVRKVIGGLHSAKILLYSVDFDEIERCQSSGNWEKSGDILGDAAVRLEKAGADCIVICANTMHKVVPQIQSMISIPIIHIAETTADVLEEQNVKRVGLLGTKYTMTQDFYKERLINRGLEVLIPNEEDMATVNKVIFEELCVGIIREGSRKQFSEIIDKLKNAGAEAVILGCTEIGLLVHAEDAVIPLIDTTKIHAKRAAQFALS